MGHLRYRALAPICVLVLLAACTPGASVGVALPHGGMHGAQGASASTMAQLGITAQHGNAVGVAVAPQSLANPHADEGSDDGLERANAPRAIASAAADSAVRVLVGGLDPVTVAIDAAAGERAGLPLVTAGGRDPVTNAFCVCASRARLRTAAVIVATDRFGPHVIRAEPGDSATSIAAARERVARVRPDAIVVPLPIPAVLIARRDIADAILDLDYLRQFEHRGYRFAPPHPVAHDALLVVTPQWTTSERARAVLAAYRAAQGVPADPSLLAWYAAGEVAAKAAAAGGRTEALGELQRSSFDTVLGPVRFGSDGFWADAPAVANAVN